ncbi:MAG: ABC transporter permease [Gammaproteobacteria bacterium]
MSIQPVFLLSDILWFSLLLSLGIFSFFVYHRPHLSRPWKKVFQNPLGLLSATLLICYMVVTTVDSIHYRTLLPNHGNGELHYASHVNSLFDVLLSPMADHWEITYSKPFASSSFQRTTIDTPKGIQQVYLPLRQVKTPMMTRQSLFIEKQLLTSLWQGMAMTLVLIGLFIMISRRYKRENSLFIIKQLLQGKTVYGWRSWFILFFLLTTLLLAIHYFIPYYHLLGTDKVGMDVFYKALKSIRTGFLIGTLTTLIMLPFAIFLGILAGYVGGWVDDIIQYIYITLSSIPAVLLIAAAILSLDIFMTNHAAWFTTVAARADARLVALCAILGLTSWTNLCRVLRGETLKLREMDYVQAAKVLGTTPFRIVTQHILPNVIPIIVITVVLDFSMLVLAEAVLTYVGVGVDPTMMSWGNMINTARMELARDPLIWWPLCAAFIFMFVLVLSANLFADAVRDAFDPKSS